MRRMSSLEACPWQKGHFAWASMLRTAQVLHIKWPQARDTFVWPGAVEVQMEHSHGTLPLIGSIWLVGLEFRRLTSAVVPYFSFAFFSIIEITPLNKCKVAIRKIPKFSSVSAFYWVRAITGVILERTKNCSKITPDIVRTPIFTKTLTFSRPRTMPPRPPREEQYPFPREALDTWLKVF